jgi:DNA (cytosine-5)-methyltransferase 1
MNYLDLFSGIGGFALGAEWAGLNWENHYFSEIDNYANKVYSKNSPGAVALGYITKVEPDKLPQGDWVLSAGFPCQDISIAGAGAGIEGPRSSLWFEAWRVIRDLRPRVAILENVPALTFRGLGTVLGNLAEIGYDAEWQVLSAEQFGAPHLRRRIWIVTYPNNERPEWGIQPQKKIKEPMLIRPRHSRRDWIMAYPNKVRAENKLADTYIQEQQGERFSIQSKPNRQTGSSSPQQKQKMGQSKSIHAQGLNRGQRQGESRRASGWQTEPNVGRVANGIPSRVDRLKGLGNAIVPQIAEYLFRLIARGQNDDHSK